MQKIHKYPITAITATLMLPADATVIHVDVQRPAMPIFLWVMLDTAAPTVKRRFVTVGTGQEIPDGVSHVGTVLDGDFVWHVVEVDLP